MKTKQLFILLAVSVVLLMGTLAYWLSAWQVGGLSKFTQLNASRFAGMTAKMLRVGSFEGLFFTGRIPPPEIQELVRNDLNAFSKGIKGVELWTGFVANGKCVLGPATDRLSFPIASASDAIVEKSVADRLAGEVPWSQAIPVTAKDGRKMACFIAPIFHARTNELLYVVGMNIDTATWRGSVWRVRWQICLSLIPLTLLLLLDLWLLFYRSLFGKYKQHLGYVEAALLVLTVAALLWPLTQCLQLRERLGQYRAFSQLVDLRVDRLADRLSGTENQLMNTADRLDRLTKDAFSEKMFHAFVAPFQVHRSFGVIWNIIHVHDEERDEFEASMREEGHPNFEIWEYGPDGSRQRAARRDIYYPLCYTSEEGESHARLIGFDYGSEPLRFETIQRALRSRRTAVSDQLSFIRNNREHSGILLLHPVFKDGDSSDLFAFLSVPIRLQDVLQNITGKYPADENMLLMDLFRIEQDGRLTFLSSSVPDKTSTAPQYVPLAHRLYSPDLFFNYVPMFYYDRMMLLVARPDAAFWTVHDTSLKQMIILIGVLAIPLLGLMAFVVRRRQTALTQLVRERSYEIMRQRDRLNEITSHVQAVLWELDLKTMRHTYISKYAEKYDIAMTDDPWTGFLDHIHPQDYERATKSLEKHFASGEPLIHEFRIIDRKGQICWFRQQITVVKENGKPVRVLGVTNDVSESRNAAENLEKMELALRNAQRLEAVGLLAGSVAHDFNNMLQVILGNTELALMEVDEDDPMYSDLSDVQKAAQKASGVTRQLLAFARKQNAAPEVQDLNTTVGDNMPVLKRLVGDEIELDLDLALSPCTVKIDSAQVSQVLTNLVMNARDAIQAAGVTEGRIKIALVPVYLKQTTCTSGQTLPEGNYICLIVSDNGSGMDDSTIAKIFDPFFSTKRRDRGTGLGLSTIHGILSQNGGGINVRSSPGNGAVFMLYVPQYEATDMAADSIPQVALENYRGTGTVMIIEDDPDVLTLTQSTLTALGYTVVLQPRALDALKLLKEGTPKIDLVLSDMIMPEMSGVGLACALAKDYPDLPIVFMSYAPGDVVDDNSAECAQIPLLPKPFSCEDLAVFIKAAFANPTVAHAKLSNKDTASSANNA